VTKSAASARSRQRHICGRAGRSSPIRARRRASGVAPAAAAVSAGDSTLLRVLTTSDLHGQLEARVWDWSQGRRSAEGGAEAVARQSRPRLRLHVGAARRRRRNAGTVLSNATFRGRDDQRHEHAGHRCAAIGITSSTGRSTRYARPHERSKYPSSRRTSRTLRGRRDGWATPWKLVTKNGVRSP